MTNNSIKAAFQRFWEHVVSKIDDKADVNHTHAWDDIEGKPFEMVGSDTLTWDGNTEGKEKIQIDSNMWIVKVSDATPTKDDIMKGCTIGSTGSSTITPSEEMLNDMLIEENEALRFELSPDMCFYIYPKGHPEGSGTYFGYVESLSGNASPIYTNTLTINGYTGFNPQEKIKESCLPSGGGAFVVNFYTEDMQNWTCDKTHEEIIQARNDGKEVYGLIMGEGKVDFISIAPNGKVRLGAVFPDDTTLMSYQFVVGTDNSVTVTIATIEMTTMGS